ncbi:efflux RND transporter permease subunit [Candidatus Methylospira mobilis]|uniref:Efflux RND transporter permease subunit n=1 Tax=Candidatus Methylospira mobilis TaxID=1808979 RepID=A0A5Q0BBS2_9GAMM|nr:efflux RND transporter permease subunit [Candidatus Methylospira mobilis]QFY41220.1 efflux RND transporter permease subunit [Candidatus Methylospira mobilis]
MASNINNGPVRRGFSAEIVRLFITSKLSMLLLIASLLAGMGALLLMPREEEPQIIVPMADVWVQMPGASAEEVEKLVVTPLESRLREIDGVEYVYSSSREGEGMVTVRFYVGEDREDSLVKVWSKLMSNQDVIPPGVKGWGVRPVEIDDVPIVTLTLSSANALYDTAALRRLADEIKVKLGEVADAGKIAVVGGEPRQMEVYPDPAALAAHGLTLPEVLVALRSANISLQAGRFERGDQVIQVDAGPMFHSGDDVAMTVLKTQDNRAVYLRDVAEVRDAAEISSYTRMNFGPAAADSRHIGGQETQAAAPGEQRQAVTVAVSKRKGANAVAVAESTINMVDSLRGKLVPDDVTVSITRDYGETANHKVNELVKHLFIAILTILVLLAFALGPKESLIVALAVPMTLGVTLLFDLVAGYTINRVTLFALILSLGLLVDDPIVDVENIYRHFKLRRESPLDAALTAVDEVRPPTIFATLAVIVSFLPLFFITGMMGPYMGPMAFNVPIAMLMSLLVAFTVTPWASYHLLQSEYGKGDEAPFDLKRSSVYRWYDWALGGLLRHPMRARLFLWLTLLAFAGSAMLAVTRAVPLKLLPFDNKNEMQLVIDMPRGSTQEATDGLARELEAYLAQVNEVTDFQTYIGLASPMDFNGMVRHYYLRSGGYVGEIRINLLSKEKREQQSHQIALRLRPDIEGIAARHGGNVKIVETPPGPPVLSTFVAEVYGPPDRDYRDLAQVTRTVRGYIEGINGVRDVDDFVDEDMQRIRFDLDRQKAAQQGVTVADVAATLRIALAGEQAGIVHEPSERLPLSIRVRLQRAERSSVADLLALRVKTARGALVPLGELGQISEETVDQTIYHKNLKRLNYVIAEMVGQTPVEAVLDYWAIEKAHPLPAGYSVDLAGEGEWKITVDVFRDLGLAFGAALLMIYVLLVAQTGSLSMPLIIMVAIPLTIIGIMPGFWVLNLFTTPVAGFDNPILFTATGMIGMIALAGIVVRNSIILIDFIERLRAQGVELVEAMIEAGATRLRPIFLTAGAAMFGSFVITLDPIFSGLAWSFIFGIFASTAFSLLVVPVVYYLLNKNK